MTLESAGNKVAACLKELDRLRKEVPFLRTEYLQDMLNKARREGNKNKEKALITMLRKEYSRKQDGRIRSGFGKPASNPVSCVTTSPPGSADQVVYKGEEDTVRVCKAGIVKRNTAGNMSPFIQGDLLDNLGFMGEKSAVTEILNGTYVFPPKCDEHARRICTKASKIYAKVARETIHAFVTRKQLQEWWHTAKEDTQSSMEGIHFGHLITASWNDFLTDLYTAKINACLNLGTSLKRWGKSLTVLLEKEFGSVFFNKLRAIILFEADFNWIQK